METRELIHMTTASVLVIEAGDLYVLNPRFKTKGAPFYPIALLPLYPPILTIYPTQR